MLASQGARERRDDVLEDDEDKDEQADDNTGPPTTEIALKGDEGLDKPQDQYAHGRSSHQTDTATEQSAANDDGGNRIQFQADARSGVTGLGVEGINHTRERRTKTGKRIDENPCASDRQAHESGGLLIASQSDVRPTGRPMRVADCSSPPRA